MSRLQMLRGFIQNVRAKCKRQPRQDKRASPQLSPDEQILENIRKLPAEIRLLILEAYIRHWPSYVCGKYGRLRHFQLWGIRPLMTRQLLHSLFYAAPIRIVRHMESTSKSKPPSPEWADGTPQFLILHDKFFTASQRKNLRFQVQYVVRGEMPCRQFTRIRLFPPHLNTSLDWKDPNASVCAFRACDHGDHRKNERCKGKCVRYVTKAWQEWNRNFMNVHGLEPECVVDFDIVFMGDRQQNRGMGRVCKEASRVGVRFATGLSILTLSPVLLLGAGVYVVPVWTTEAAKAMEASSRKYWPRVKVKAKMAGAKMRLLRCSGAQDGDGNTEG